MRRLKISYAEGRLLAVKIEGVSAIPAEKAKVASKFDEIRGRISVVL